MIYEDKPGIVVDDLKALEDAHAFRNSDHILKCLQDMDDKYTKALKYGDPESLEHKVYAYRLQGVRELVTAILRPIAIESDEDLS